ncbi:contact-dependent growth inhibition system immunity protein [Paenibacillus sp. PK1-4R]|uniref:contact-dependent growth inhibition system immunity protein n=1 Tax=Paenibacillus sp. PK1-4R TaxID=3049075 RepID=UPI0025A1D907|nr:contact-dependent growth inhibition system immunity protein [Paenibacillus sp. PK1-4R]WJM08325.1 contact-dependent growth inhibition system immunity protein [Paenibacillus sp. PK1-4R]
MGKLIKEIYSVDQNVQTAIGDAPLDQWYDKLLHKSVDELDLEDVSRMLGQHVFIDLGIEKAIEILSEDPLAGEMYDGHLLKLLCSIETNNFRDLLQLKKLLQTIKSNLSQFEWADEEDQEEYAELLERFLKKVSL